MKIFDFPTQDPMLKRRNGIRNLNKFHDEYWIGIHQRITEDKERIRQANSEPMACVVGVEEYKTLINIFSRREGGFTLPEEYGKIPIVLCPVTSLCSVVPAPKHFWFEFING